MSHPSASTFAPQVVSAKAVLYASKGDEDVVSVGARDVRPPQAGEVRIRVLAAAVNPTDILLRDPGRADVAVPMTPGMDAAGTVEAVGPAVEHLKVGQDVMAAVSPVRPEGGAQASHIVVPAASVVALPAGITMAEAATIPMNGLTARYALEIAELREGQTLAVSGGAGLLACYTIAIAKTRGLRVIADAKREEQDLVRGYGADVVVDRALPFAAAVRAACPKGVDALLDTALLGEASFDALRDGGTYIPVRGWDGRAAPRDLRIRPVMVPQVLQRTDWLDELRALIERRVIVPRLAGTYAPEQVLVAQRRVLAGGLRGRPVLMF